MEHHRLTGMVWFSIEGGGGGGGGASGGCQGGLQYDSLNVSIKEDIDMSEMNDSKQWNITDQQVWFSRGVWRGCHAGGGGGYTV